MHSIIGERIGKAVIAALSGLVTTRKVYDFFELGAEHPPKGIFVNHQTNPTGCTINIDNVFNTSKENQEQLLALYELTKLVKFKELVNNKIGYELLANISSRINEGKSYSLSIHYEINNNVINANVEVWTELLNKINSI